MRRKSFTLFELLLTVIVVGILAAIAFPVYQNMKNDAQAKVCETSLIALQAAFNNCVMEKGVAVCLAPLTMPFLTDIAQGSRKMISCPADTDSPVTTSQGVSYGYNSVLNTIISGDPTGSKRYFQKLPADLIIIGDCQNTTFSTVADLAKRHKVNGKTFALGVTKQFKLNQGKRIKKITAANESCHAIYQACLQGCFDANKDLDVTTRTNCYAACVPGPDCSGDYN